MEFQSDKTAIRQLYNFGFKINWTLIKFAYENRYESFIMTKEEIINYGEFCLKHDECYNENIIDLVDSKTDEMDFLDALARLAQGEVCNLNLQKRKWYYYLIFNVYKNLPCDWFEGIMQLVEIYVSLDLFNCGIMELQGRNNNLTPEQFYNSSHYEILKENFRKWLRDEREDIIRSE